ncbi:hypothetical protein J8273_7625 [Carpediemonas membranifera]|uniref:Uncharacterized protein n=1 Tax=Carpediemonas membranifera TaxID=201153 RepID=A0A8J6E048_9EUKA|nr:hypothetical protein J8273_7625 [Carpediemonas membranifera]|eukprot:KAG9391301.1 hypothetical protein J8273_7625 [Carpediemonas membranifera]
MSSPHLVPVTPISPPGDYHQGPGIAAAKVQPSKVPDSPLGPHADHLQGPGIAAAEPQTPREGWGSDSSTTSSSVEELPPGSLALPSSRSARASAPNLVGWGLRSPQRRLFRSFQGKAVPRRLQLARSPASPGPHNGEGAAPFVTPLASSPAGARTVRQPVAPLASALDALSTLDRIAMDWHSCAYAFVDMLHEGTDEDQPVENLQAILAFQRTSQSQMVMYRSSRGALERALRQYVPSVSHFLADGSPSVEFLGAGTPQ